jgi:hypothetical protein
MPSRVLRRQAGCLAEADHGVTGLEQGRRELAIAETAGLGVNEKLQHLAFGHGRVNR